MSRRLTLALVLVALLALPAGAAAHGGTTAGTDYRTTITSVPAGLDVRVIGGDDRLEVTRTTAQTIVIAGYGGEPYLRLDESGVWENRSSPAVALNAERQPTAPLDGTRAAPDWVRTSSGRTVVFHDHRSHWMASQPPAVARADPGARHALSDWSVPVNVDGRATAITGGLTWLGTPQTGLWWIAAALAAVAGIAAGVLLRVHPTLVAGAGAALVVAAGVAVGASQRADLPDGTTDALVAAAFPLVLLLIAVAVAWRTRGLSALGATGFLLAAFIAGGDTVIGELDTAFAYALVPGPLPTVVTRILLVLGVLGLGLAAGASARAWIAYVQARAPQAREAAW